MRQLIKNAFVVSVDPAVGNQDGADILIEHGKIVAIGRNIDAGEADVFDATGFIASPGFVDTHHHIWQSAIRGITGDWSIRDYIAGIRLFIASSYDPDDMYAAQLSGASQALFYGTTTTADYSHNLNSPEHVEQAIRGVQDSGARVVWCFGFNQPPMSAPGFQTREQRGAYLRQTAARHFSSADARVTLGVCPEESWFWSDAAQGRFQFELARDLDAHIFWHANSTRGLWDNQLRGDIARLAQAGLLGADLTLVHMGHTTDEEWSRVADAGAHVSITPETELQMNMGWPAIQPARERGINFGLGIDIVSNNSADLRFQLRLLLQTGRRMLDANLSGSLHRGVPIHCAEALYWGTLGGARALGIDRTVGSLTPGKAADILLHDTRGPTMAGWDRTQPEAALLLQAGPEVLDSVLVDGRFVKRHQRLAIDVERSSDLLRKANERIVARMDQKGGVSSALQREITRETTREPG